MDTNEKQTDFFSRTIVVWLGALICCALWGSAFPSIKIGYRSYGIAASDTAAQILFAGMRFTLAGVLAVVFGSLIRGEFLKPTRQSLPKVVWLCMLQTVLQYFCFYIGLAHTSGVKGSIIEAISVFVAVLVASLIFRQEKLSAAKILGCIVGFAGVVLINMNGLDFSVTPAGEGMILLSTIAYAFSSVFLKRFSVTEDPVMLSGWQFIFGGLIMIAGGLLMGGRVTVETLPQAMLLLYMAFLSAAAYSLWGILLKHNPVSKVAVFGFMNPVFGVIFSAVLLGEADQASGPTAVIALLLVCIGIFIVNRKPEGKEASNGQPE